MHTSQGTQHEIIKLRKLHVVLGVEEMETEGLHDVEKTPDIVLHSNLCHFMSMLETRRRCSTVL
jgi:hypothetical protein